MQMLSILKASPLFDLLLLQLEYTTASTNTYQTN